MRASLSLTSLLLLALVCLPGVSQAAGKSSYSASSEGKVLVLLDHIRVQHGLPPFEDTTALRASARAHSADMIAHDYFEHDSRNESFGKRIRHYLASPLVGEDMAWGTGSYGTPEGLVRMWMHSPTHRHIILMPNLRRIGLGIAIGTFQGSPGAVMATADFSV